MVANVPFGVLVGVFGSIILIMAVNTAYVASSELLERVAHRYRMDWLIATNQRASLYRIHIVNGSLYTGIILLTRGSQSVLAEMYAVGLLASFCLNIGCLLIYRYFRGTKDIRDYYTSRTGTLVLEFILVACFIYLALHKPYGTGLWASVVSVILLAGIPFSRRYGPEVKEKRRSDCRWRCCSRSGRRTVRCTSGSAGRASSTRGWRPRVPTFVTFFSPRQVIPDKLGPSHYRFHIQGGSVYASIVVVLELLVDELAGRDITVHFGWPTSSWVDRMATGVFVHNLMRLPPKYPAAALRDRVCRRRSAARRDGERSAGRLAGRHRPSTRVRKSIVSRATRSRSTSSVRMCQLRSSTCHSTSRDPRRRRSSSRFDTGAT